MRRKKKANQPSSKTSGQEESVSSLPAKRRADSAARREEKPPTKFALFCLTTLGIVFGDIGTSPLYTVRECFRPGDSAPALAPDPANVLGVLSLITWSLVIIISIKYLLYVMAADNKGEGGILALLALLNRRAGQRFWFSMLSVFGAALLYGDGMITPAISVVSAVEGLKIATPIFDPYIVPLAVVLLVLLFLFQRHGTAKVGLVFGPIMLVWFLVLAALGLNALVRHPEVLAALNPWQAVTFFGRNGWSGFVILGAVFLAVTGGEALYADLGHFGRTPIRLAWFLVVLPALLLNYYGQGALVLAGAGQVQHPFFNLAPKWALYPLVALSTMAAIIASQAVISGVFSLTRQAVLLDQFPRVRILQTSSEEIGQVYIPVINYLLMIACVGLVVGFRSSEKLAGAYGVAVSTTMVITTILAAIIAREIWKWNRLSVLLVTVVFLLIDLAFFGANILKFIEGGWFPLLVGALLFVLMTTWKRGRVLLRKRLLTTTESVDEVLDSAGDKAIQRVPGTSIFLTNRPRGMPPVLVRHMEHSHSLTEHVIVLHIATIDVPHVPLTERIDFEKLRHGIYRVRLTFGFIDLPDVPEALKQLTIEGVEIKPDEVTYYVARGIVLQRERNPGMMRWREALFAFLLQNATHAIEFFHIPPRQVVELGLEIDI
ncbi:MAG: potassium transporter Kup [Chthoniobacterales bacterium]